MYLFTTFLLEYIEIKCNKVTIFETVHIHFISVNFKLKYSVYNRKIPKDLNR
jgi:hypothetical protein